METKSADLHAVTGAFGYSGKYIAERLLAEGVSLITLTNSLQRENRVIDAIGPETFTYRELAARVGEIIGKRRPVVSIPPSLGYAVGWVIGRLVGDVMITREEIAGLMANLLYVDSPPAGNTRLTDWARERASTLGLRYTSELERRRDRQAEYRSN